MYLTTSKYNPMVVRKGESTCGCGKYQGNQLSNMQVSIFVLGNDYDVFEDDVLRIFVCESSCKFLKSLWRISIC